MGVKDLWTVLEPVGERCTMADLQGKRLAVDISGWIFQSLQSPVFIKNPTLRPHLRNLFWRLHHLMRNNVRVIIVFDGPSPKLKGVALTKRAEARRQQRKKDQIVEEESVEDLASSCGTAVAGFRASNVAENTYFTQLCAECKEMLRVFRIPYIVSSGDAESTCAYLNRLGCVDGCITDDNDAFLFGASVVYRHYTCDKKRVENLQCYDAKVIEEQLGLTQDHLIAMALILGCDYGLNGIKGIGKERALEVLQSWPGCDPLEKLSQWRTDVDLTALTKFDPATKPEHCRYCGHLGNMTDHKSDGCNGCAREGRVCARTNSEDWKCHCEWHRKHAEFKSKQVEIKIMKAAIEDSNFPDRDVIDIYKQQYPDDHPGTFCWTRPQFAEMQRFMSRLFGWPKDKIREKIITYVTAFDLCAVMYGDLPYHHCSQPEKVLAKRVENGREMYEVQWRTIPDVPLAEDEAAQKEVITRELKDVFTAVFTEVSAEFEDMKKLAKKKSGKSKRKCSKADDEDTCLEEPNSADPKKAKKSGKLKSKCSKADKEDTCLEQSSSPVPKKATKTRKSKSKSSNLDEQGTFTEEPRTPVPKKTRKQAKNKSCKTAESSSDVIETENNVVVTDTDTARKSGKSKSEITNADEQDTCMEEPSIPVPKQARKQAKKKSFKTAEASSAVTENENNVVVIDSDTDKNDSNTEIVEI